MTKSSFYILSLLFVWILESCHNDGPEPSNTEATPDSKSEISYSDTGLPIVYIRTLTGQSIRDKKTWIPSVLHIPAHDSLPEIFDTIYIKGRGNATWRFAKKAFNMKCSKRQAILGMKKHKRWVFLANYHDRTLMRNELTFFIGQMCSGLEWTPHCQYAEVVLNGVHQGNYLVTEQIRIDKNRIAIDELTPEDTDEPTITGGYLLEIDHYYDRSYKFRTAGHALPVGVVAPDEDEIQPVQFTYIKSFVQDFDYNLIIGASEHLLANYVDMKSFADYYIVQTLTGNHEMSAPRSVYCYKKRNGPIYAGPLWDFDFSTYNSENEQMNIKSIWYKSLLTRRDFCNCLKQRWNELRPIFESRIPRHIEETLNYLQLSQKLNFELFPITSSGAYKNGDESLDYNSAVNKLKIVVQLRILRMDRFINSL